jgi:hypothetical protein
LTLGEGFLRKRRPKISPFGRGVLGSKESLLGGTLGPIRDSGQFKADEMWHAGHTQQLI